MARKMNETEARGHIVHFTDNRNKSEKDIFKFGIDMGPGLPIKSRLVFYRTHHDSQKQNYILLEEENPFVVIQPISYVELLVHATHLREMALKYAPSVLTRGIYLLTWDTNKWHTWSVFRLVNRMNQIIEILAPFFPAEELFQVIPVETVIVTTKEISEK